jgi:prepilin-type N-terminal cleavage/methylation domain-containing protein
MKKQAGFTLVEIAIVLVIIGLLLGGVLKGQELINQAKIKNLANDLNGLTAAIYSYQDRYRVLPGEDEQAATRWSITQTVFRNGQYNAGDATTSSDFCAAVGNNNESTLFWQHLRGSGLIGGAVTDGNHPQNAVGGIIGIQTNAGLPDSPDLAGTVVCSSNLAAKIAESLDAQFDDGRGNSGTVRGYVQGTPSAPTPITTGCTSNPTRVASVQYVDSGAALYTICKSL